MSVETLKKDGEVTGWRVRWLYDGKKQSKSFPKKKGFKKKDASDFNDKMQRLIKEGDIVAAHSQTPFKELCEDYKKSIKVDMANGELAERTVKWHTWQVNVMLQCPEFKRLKMKDFRNIHYINFREWLVSSDGKNLHLSSSAKIITTFKDVMRHGRSKQMTNFVPDDSNIRTRRKTKNATKINVVTRKDIPSAQQASDIINNAQGVLFDVLYTIFETGVRIGECLALEWKSIDLDNGLIYVEQNLDIRGEIKPSVKTHAGERAIPIHSGLQAHLEKLKERSTSS